MTYTSKIVIAAAASIVVLSGFTSATFAMGSDREPETANLFTSSTPYKAEAVNKTAIAPLTRVAAQDSFIGNQLFADQK